MSDERVPADVLRTMPLTERRHNDGQRAVCVWHRIAAVILAVIIANKRYGKTSPAPPPPPPPPSWPGAGYTPPPAAPPAAATGRPWCPHAGAEPVDLVTGERVAWVCPDCSARLDPGFRVQVKERA